MAEIIIGKTYRDTIHGAQGVAEAFVHDEAEDVDLTQLRLNREHLDGSHDLQAQDLRWYPNDRLELVAGKGK